MVICHWEGGNGGGKHDLVSLASFLKHKKLPNK